MAEEDIKAKQSYEIGNYFIMDTEQVISNPYQDLQSEAVDGGKKNSLTERLTSVRNNVCEHNLRTRSRHIEKQCTHSMRNMHMDTSNLRYQVKVMDLTKRKNDLAFQKRLLPKKDFSYDHRQINNSAKRLGISSENSFYLDKKLKFPLRGHIVKDHDQKPIIKKARQTMAGHSVRKKGDERSPTSRTNERATTANTVSTAVPSPEPFTKEQHSGAKRIFPRGSKSAPPPKISFNEPQMSDARLTVINEGKGEKLPVIQTPAGNRSLASAKSHVKFNVKMPLSQSSQGNMKRSHTYHTDLRRQTRSYGDTWDTDSDDDDYLFCEKVDLRKLLFGDKAQSSDTKSTTSGTTTPRTRFSADYPVMSRPQTAKTPKVTEEMMIKEQTSIRYKVNKFLGTINKPKMKPKKEEVKVEEIPEPAEKDVKAKAAILLSVFSKPIDHSKTWGFTLPKPKKEVKVEQKVEAEKKPESADSQSRKTQNLWDLIKTNVNSGKIHRKYTANDLLLQQLTGILVQADKNPKIPIHAASRALRHTPTFKMRRVVEELMRTRTRYEQQEVEKLQQAESLQNSSVPLEEESGVHEYPPRAWGTPTQELEVI